LSKICVYDLIAGKFLGEMLIPLTENCNHYKYKLVKHAVPLVTLDITTAATFGCEEKRILFITVYNVLRGHEDNEIYGKLVKNGSVKTRIPDGPEIDLRIKYFPLQTGVCFIFSYRKVLKLTFFDYTQHGFALTQQCTLPIQGHFNFLASNYILNIFLGRIESTRSHIKGFKIITKCVSSKPFTTNLSNVKEYVVRQFHIDIRGLSQIDLKQIKIEHVIFDQQQNILINHHKDHSGIETYDVVDIYRPIS
jgi:hypothetical protein